jgi:hypothetical protein
MTAIEEITRLLGALSHLGQSIDVLPGSESAHSAQFNKEVTVAPLNIFEVSPHDYLRQARKLFTYGNQLADLTDVFANAKRALDTRLDELLTLCLIRRLRKRRDFPTKLHDIEAFGLRIGNVAQKYVSELRNIIEHEHRIASPEEAQHALELAELAVQATDRHVESARVRLSCVYYGPIPEVERLGVIRSGCRYDLVLDYDEEMVTYAVRGTHDDTAVVRIADLEREDVYRFISLLWKAFPVIDEEPGLTTWTADWRDARDEALKSLGLS